MTQSSYYVYKHLDVNGSLLYIGCTQDIEQRTSSHRTSASWYSEVHSLSIEEYETRAEANKREKELIRALAPPNNKSYHPARFKNSVVVLPESLKPWAETRAVTIAELDKTREETKKGKAQARKEADRAKYAQESEERLLARENLPRRCRASVDFYSDILCSIYIDLFFLQYGLDRANPSTIVEAILESSTLCNAYKVVSGVALTAKHIRRALEKTFTKCKAVEYSFELDLVYYGQTKYNYIYSKEQSAIYYSTNLWVKVGDQLTVRAQEVFPEDESLDLQKGDFFLLMSTLYQLYLIHCDLTNKTPNTEREA